MKHQVKHPLQMLIDRFYDSSVDDKGWAGLADELARALGSTSAVLKVQDAKEYIYLFDMTENLLVSPRQQDWADHWHRNDLWVERSVAHGMSKIITNRDLIPDDEFERTDFYGDWIRHLDIYHMIGAVFPAGKGMVGVVGIHRPYGRGAYEEQDRRRLAEVLPHLQRAFCLHQKLAQAQQGVAVAFEALERAHSAVIILDAHASILFASKLAEQLLRGVREICIAQGRLEIRQPSTSMRLAQLVQGCIQTASGMACSSGGAIAIRREGKLPLTLSVFPLHPGVTSSALTQPAALIFIRDPEALTSHAETLRHLFGLTRTEAAVAEALAEGRGLPEIAEAFAIGMGTVRSHLKKILSKTNTSKQAELVALLLRSAAGI